MAMAGVNTAALGSYSAETCARPDLVALRDRVTVRGDVALSDTEARIVLNVDGRRRQASADVLALSDPVEIERRLREKFAALHGVDAATELWGVIKGLSQSDNLGALVGWVGKAPAGDR